MNKYVSVGEDFDSFLQKEISSLRRVRSGGLSISGEASSAASHIVGNCPKSADISVPIDCDDDPMPTVPKLSSTEATESELMTREDALAAIERNGEWVYELFAVLIHAGAIYGGHYYAYIKDLDTGKWMNFNDSSVTEIAEEKVKESWGGTTTSYSSAYYSSYTSTSSANAYMLQYRKVRSPLARVSSSSPLALTTFPGDDFIPEYIHTAVKVIEEEKKEQERLHQERCHI